MWLYYKLCCNHFFSLNGCFKLICFLSEIIKLGWKIYQCCYYLSLSNLCLNNSLNQCKSNHLIYISWCQNLVSKVKCEIEKQKLTSCYFSNFCNKQNHSPMISFKSKSVTLKTVSWQGDAGSTQDNYPILWSEWIPNVSALEMTHPTAITDYVGIQYAFVKDLRW